jgi:hypothetical protein
LPESLVPKLGMSVFGQGKFVERKLEKCRRNTSIVLANKKQP